VNEFKDDFVIFDDLQESCQGSMVTKLFSQVAHHSNVTFFFLIQNFFHLPRSMTVNGHYLIFMSNPRDKLQIRTLSHQMFPNNPKFLVNAFEDATDNKPFSHLLLDLCVETVKELRVRANILGPSITVYLQKA
jgi:hypothetical protein